MTNWIRFIGPFFTMQIPSEWMVISSMKFQVMFLSPPLQDGRSLNLVLLMQTSPDSPQAHLHQLVKPQAEARDNFNLLADEPFTTTSGDIGHLLAFSAEYDQSLVLQRHLIFKQANTLYWFVATLPANIDDKLRDQIDSLFQTMLQSFTFTETNLEAILG